MKNWRINKRLGFAFSAMIVLGALTGLVGWVLVHGIGRIQKDLTEDYLPAMAQSADMMQNSSMIYATMLNAVLSTNPATQKQLAGEIKSISATNAELLANAEIYCDTPDERACLEKIKKSRSDYLLVRQEIFGLCESGQPQQALALLTRKGQTAYANLYMAYMGLNDLETDLALKSSGDIKSDVKSSKAMLLGSIGVELMAGVLLTVLLVRSLGNKLRKIAMEIGSSTGQVATAAESISASSQSLANGASAQAASLEQTSASLEMLANMTQRNATNSRSTNELSSQTRAAAEKGVGDMQTMEAAMQEIKNSSDDVAKIIKTIDEIAFQTNILALNAAVEAARAGEAGMGFAVVADEVRNLAQRSAQAARETTAKIQDAINKNIQGVELSRKVGLALNDIVTSARKMDELAAEVAGASSEQAEGIKQINSAVGQMDKITQSNAANAEETATATERLGLQAAAMRSSVQELAWLVSSGQETRTAGANHSLPASGPVTKTERPTFAPSGEQRRLELPMELN